MDKATLRNIYKQKRREFTEDQIKKLQDNIFNQLTQIDFSKAQNFHVFLTIEKQNEIDTKRIIKYLRQNNKTIIVSKSNFKNNTLTHFIFDKNTKLEVNQYGIPEPVDAIQVDEKTIDVVFVPLLISDEQNYRVGYGKGFYDRFLNNCRKDCKKIGLNFFKPIANISDVNEFDITLDEVIYPSS